MRTLTAKHLTWTFVWPSGRQTFPEDTPAAVVIRSQIVEA